MREDLVKKLMLFGLNTYEARAYMALVLRGTATASELSDISGVPYTRIYDVLSSLENKGFIITIPGKPIRYKAIHPRQALEGIRRTILEECETKLRELDHASRDLLAYLTPLYEKNTTAIKESLALVRGRLAAENMLIALLEQETPDTVVILLTPNTYYRLTKRTPSIYDIIKQHKDTKYIIIIESETPIPHPEIKVPENTEIKHRKTQPSVNQALLSETTYIYEAIPDDTTPSSSYDVAFIIRNKTYTEHMKNIYKSLLPIII